MTNFGEAASGKTLPHEALRATQALRCSPGYDSLHASERAELDYHLGRVENVLRGDPSYGQAASSQHHRKEYGSADIRPLGNDNPEISSQTVSPPSGYQTNPFFAADPYALAPVSHPLATPNDLTNMPGIRNRQSDVQQQPQPTQKDAQSAQPQRPSRPAGTEVLGERTRRALEAVDFPSFVAELIQGTFVAIVDATSQQVREYAKLVADLSQTVDQFTESNVSINQARDELVSRHPQDLRLVLPGPGETAEPRVEPFSDSDDSPSWLNEYGLDGADLTPELAEGPLLNASRKRIGEERMRALATMVLMGINRIVIDDGQLKARLQFHARAREKVSADIIAQSGGQQIGIAARQNTLQSGVSTMVSTVDVNSQADVALKADLVGEVALKFRTETFDLNNFADANIIQTITRHSQTRQHPGIPVNSSSTVNQPDGTPPETLNPAPGQNSGQPE